MDTSGLIKCILVVVLSGWSTAEAQFKSAKIADVDEKVSPDPSIAISLKDLKTLVVGVSPDKVFYSHDGGVTWNGVTLQSKLGVRGSIRVIESPKGEFDLVHQCDAVAGHTNPGFVMQSTSDKGVTWKEGVFFGHYSSKDPQDIKDELSLSMSWHPKKRTLFAVWSQADQYGLQDPNCHSNILFGSWGGGKTWSKSSQINQTPGNCMGTEQSAGGASVVMDMKERLFVVWSNQGIIFFDRSYDDGKMWLTRDLAITQPAKMILNVPGFPPLITKPNLVVDNTELKSGGNLYAVYAEGSKGSIDTNIAMMRSTNRGDHWVGPTRFRKEDTGGQQFAPSVAIDQTTGHIFIAYYDRRGYEDTKTDVFIAYSYDGGNNFIETKVTSESFIPAASNTANPWTSITAHAGTVAVTWTRVDDNRVSVWAAILNEDDLKSKKEEETKSK